MPDKPVPEYDAAAKWLADRRRPLLASHRRPDGDALGAIAGLSRLLAQRGAAPAALLFEPFPARYTVLKGDGEWRELPPGPSPATAWADRDALVILDTCSSSQLEPIAAGLPQAPPTLVIDHHRTADDIGCRAGDLRVIDASAGACCLMIAELALSRGWTIDAPAATALYTGMATDCGWFRFSNADARLLRAAAEMVERGAKPDRLYEAIYQQEPAARLRLIGRMLAGLELRAGGRLTVLRVRQSDFAASGADESMTEDLVNEAGRIAGNVATAMFSEQVDGEVRINLRSRHTVDVSRLAQRFGGGGHERAAGARQRGDFEQIVALVCAAVEAELSHGD